MVERQAPRDGSPIKTARPLQEDRAAVSPVIATILMVAITVVLAAVLYVMVSQFLTPATPTRTLGVDIRKSVDGTTWVLTLVSVPPGLGMTETTLEILRADGTTNLTRTALSSLSGCPVYTSGACFEGDGDAGVDVAERVLLRSDWYPRGQVIIADATSILFTRNFL